MSQSKARLHPCLSCGACCSYFRVLFDVQEMTDPQYSPPSDYVVKVDETTNAMMGTLEQRIRCVALSGKIGESVQCSIYENRPSCCRGFSASYENGQRNRRCDKARLSKGLRALEPKDWPSSQEQENELLGSP